MDFELPEPIRVESESGDRLILVRPGAGSNEFVTIDFEGRCWELGNHSVKILKVASPAYKYRSRNWKMRMVADAIRGLLALDQGCFQEEAFAFMNEGDSIPDEKPDLPLEEPLVATEPAPESTIPTATLPDPLPAAAPPPGTTITYAWKRMVDGQISQDINAPTPEALFLLAGFRPFRVLDPIQGFQCVPVQWIDGRWDEIKGYA